MGNDERLGRAETAIGELQRSVERMERRLSVLESSLAAMIAAGHDASSARHGLPDEERAGAAPAARPRHDLVTVMSYVGRTFVALGGAYFLRALTEGAVLRPPLGVACGLLYAIAWIVMADRAAAGSRPLSAAFHAAVASMIGFPLLWEAATRFKLLGTEATVVVMAVLTAATLAVAVRHRLESVAWVVVLPAVTTSMMMMGATGFVLPFAVYLIGLGVATLWLGYLPLYWRFLRWPAAFAADLSVFALSLRISSHNQSDPPLAVIAVQLLLLTGYLFTIVVRTLIRGRDVIPFEIVQTAVALIVGFGGAVYVAGVTGAGERSLAAINLAAGIACYGVAFTFVARRQGLHRNFYFYTSLAFVLVVVSADLMLRHDMAAATFAVLAILSSWVAWRVRHIALNLHAAGYLFIAARQSGLLSSAAYAFLAPVAAAWPPLTPAALVVLSAAVVCWLVPMSQQAETWGAYSRLPRLVIIVVLAWSLGGATVVLLTALLSGAPGVGANAGVVATIRTTVLATAALLLAWLGRFDRVRESAHLVYPVLVAGGLKLVAEDFRYSRPSTLFIALALYGTALIVAPRLIRRPFDRPQRHA